MLIIIAIVTIKDSFESIIETKYKISNKAKSKNLQFAFEFIKYVAVTI